MLVVVDLHEELVVDIGREGGQTDSHIVGADGEHAGEVTHKLELFLEVGFSHGTGRVQQEVDVCWFVLTT